MSKHNQDQWAYTGKTPAPLSTFENGHLDIKAGEAGTPIAQLALPLGTNPEQHAKVEANAERIIHCVNNFDEVVESLEGFIHSVEHERAVHGRIVEAMENAKEVIKNTQR